MPLSLVPPTDGTVIVGIDEAGRGPLAGPVVAAACLLPCPLYRRRRAFTAWSPHKKQRADEPLLADSKVLTPEERERAFAWISTHCIHGIGMSSVHDIEELGIVGATEKAMQDALVILTQHATPTVLLVDGSDHFWFDYPHISIIGGDGIEPCIAAASILAKVTRDAWMREAAKEYPAYGFEQHKGYGTEAHIAAIKKYGPCVLHRTSFLTRIIASSSQHQPTAAHPR
jgi:ribonuclease HII